MPLPRSIADTGGQTTTDLAQALQQRVQEGRKQVVLAAGKPLLESYAKSAQHKFDAAEQQRLRDLSARHSLHQNGAGSPLKPDEEDERARLVARVREQKEEAAKTKAAEQTVKIKSPPPCVSRPISV